jgi:hypothetical protein
MDFGRVADPADLACCFDRPAAAALCSLDSQYLSKSLLKYHLNDRPQTTTAYGDESARTQRQTLALQNKARPHGCGKAATGIGIAGDFHDRRRNST